MERERDGIVLEGVVRHFVTVASTDTEIYGHKETKYVTIKKEKHFLPFQEKSQRRKEGSPSE